MADIYGDTGQDPRVQQVFARCLNALWARGTKAVLADYIAGRGI